jgi:hypothetical protein
LTRLDYHEQGTKDGPSPFAQLSSQTKPVFPYLSTVIFKDILCPQDRLCDLLHFLEIHSGSLQRLSVYMQLGAENRWYSGFESWHEPNEMLKESTALLWKTVERLINLRLLSVDLSCALLGCAPQSVIHLSELQGVYVHTNSNMVSLNWRQEGIHPVRVLLPS